MLRRYEAALGISIFSTLVANCNPKPVGAPSAPSPKLSLLAPSTPAVASTTPSSVASGSATASASTEAPTPIPLPQPLTSLPRLLCHNRNGCTLQDRVGKAITVGTDSHYVQRVTLPAPPPPMPQANPSPSPEGTNQKPSPQCNLEEFWLVAESPQGLVVDYQLLTGGCSGEVPPEDSCELPPRTEVTVERDRLKVSWGGPLLGCMGAFDSTSSPVFSLKSFLPLESRALSCHDFAGYCWGGGWSFDKRTGYTAFSFRPLKREKDDCPSLGEEVSLTIPSLVLPKEFEEKGWRTSSITPCAGLLDTGSLKRRGLGPKSPSVVPDMVLAALAASPAGPLYLELVTEVTPGKAAFIEVCGSDQERYYESSYCRYPPPELDCTRFDLNGTVLQGTAKVERAEGTLRFRVTRASETRSFFLRYRDPSRGKEIRTSRRAPGQRFADGSFEPLEEKGSRCGTVDNKLVFTQGRPPRDRALTSQ